MRKTHRKFLFLVSVVILAAGALVMLWRHPPLADTAANRNAIYSAVFQKMAASRQRPYTGLSVDSHDPDAAMMMRFVSSNGVVPGSRITAANGVFVDQKTGQSAEMFGVHPTTMTWSGPFHVSIDAGAHGSLLDGSEGTYFLVRTNGQWKVDRYRDSGVRF